MTEPSAHHGRSPVRRHFGPALAVAAGAVMVHVGLARVAQEWYVDRYPPAIDEAGTLLFAWRFLDPAAYGCASRDEVWRTFPKAPLYFLAVTATQQGGPSRAAALLVNPAVLVLLAALTFRLARRCADGSAGAAATAAGLLAFFPAGFIASETLGEEPLAALGATLLLCAVVSAAPRASLLWALLGTMVALGAKSMGVLYVAAALGAGLAMRPKPAWRGLCAGIVLGALVAALFYRHQPHLLTGDLYRRAFHQAKYPAFFTAANLLYYPRMLLVTVLPPVVLPAVLAVAAAAGWCRARGAAPTTGGGAPRALAVFLGLCLAAMLASTNNAGKFLVPLLPAIAVWAAAGTVRLPARRWRPAAQALLVGACAVNGVALHVVPGWFERSVIVPLRAIAADTALAVEARPADRTEPGAESRGRGSNFLPDTAVPNPCLSIVDVLAARPPPSGGVWRVLVVPHREFLNANTLAWTARERGLRLHGWFPEAPRLREQLAEADGLVLADGDQGQRDAGAEECDRLVRALLVADDRREWQPAAVPAARGVALFLRAARVPTAHRR